MAMPPSILKKRGSNATSHAESAKVGFRLPSADEVDVEKALLEGSKCSSMDGSYRNLLSALKSEDTDDAALARLLRRIKNHAQLIERHSDQVAETLLKLKVLRRGADVMEMFAKLVCDFVCLHPFFLHHVITAVLGIFMSPDAVSDEIPASQRRERFNQLHGIFREIFRLVPTAPLSLVSVAADTFPYLNRAGVQQACLVGQLLVVASYIPDQRPELLQLLSYKALQIDLHCPKDDIQEAEEEDDEEEDMETDVFAMDQDAKSKPDVERSPDEMKHKLADTLDRMLEQFYLYIREQCRVNDKESSSIDWDKTKVVFKDFLTVFDKIVLPTHKCCHLQFLLFYLCSLRPALADAFLDYLWKKVQNPSTATVIRQASAFYIGSFLARAKFVPLSTVRDCLSLVCRWAHAYLSSLEEGTALLHPDVARHGTFYAVCQTALYVFAFHHRSLAHGEKGLQFLRDLNLEALVMCPLNPLKVCLPAVVQRFASVARHYQLVYCYSVIERNQRTALPVEAGTTLYGTSRGDDVALDAFFPFDPYLLKRTGKWINPLYRPFENAPDGPVLDEDNEDEPEEAMCKSPKSPSSVTDMFSYGTSPGFKLSLSLNHR
ncbi:unnamed protein product [Ixodes persulcatus]